MHSGLGAEKNHAFPFNSIETNKQYHACRYIKRKSYKNSITKYNTNQDIIQKNLRGLQSVSGEPIYPSGQVHSGSWFITLQIALGAHGFRSAQGFIHFVFSHALKRGHSSFS